MILYSASQWLLCFSLGVGAVLSESHKSSTTVAQIRGLTEKWNPLW